MFVFIFHEKYDMLWQNSEAWKTLSENQYF